MSLKTYVINLESSSVRRQYMEGILAPYSFLDVEFVTAIDGRLMSEDERNTYFDLRKSRGLYGRSLNAGEIGCALSHRKVYDKIVHGREPFALVLEDDISIRRDLNRLDLEAINHILLSPKPRVLMLSGDYSYWRRKPIVSLYSALGAYAYVINKPAAERILSLNPPCCVADDWMFYKRKHLKLYGVYPYMIDANMNMSVLGSDVKQDDWGIDRKNMSKREIVIGYYTGFTKKLFKLFNHFEYKVRIINNVIVERQKNPFK